MNTENLKLKNNKVPFKSDYPAGAESVTYEIIHCFLECHSERNEVKSRNPLIKIVRDSSTTATPPVGMTAYCASFAFVVYDQLRQ